MIDHALFPSTDEQPDAPDVERIHVRRLEKGQYVWCPTLFDADQLPSLEALHEKFGGGTYEVVARSTKNDDGRNLISGRRTYQLPGAPKPLFPGGVDVAPEASAASPIAAPPAPPAPGAFSSGSPLWPALLALIPPVIQAWLGSQKEHTALLMTMMQQQQQTTIAMMQNQKQDSNAFVQAMAKMNEAEKATMVAFVSELAKAKSGNGGGGEMDGLMVGLELAEKMRGSSGGGGDGDLGQLAALFGQLAQLKAAEAAAAAATSNPAPTVAPATPITNSG